MDRQPADKEMKKRKPRPRMPTVEGPDETGVLYEIKFLEDKYVGNDLHSILSFYFRSFPREIKTV